jgi:hypothetical protein
VTPRWVKGAVVCAVAAGLGYWLWTSARGWDEQFIGALLASLAGFASAPVLIWAGMRMWRERGNHVLVLGSAVAWLVIGGHVVEDDVGAIGTAALLMVFVGLGGVLATATARS